MKTRGSVQIGVQPDRCSRTDLQAICCDGKNKRASLCIAVNCDGSRSACGGVQPGIGGPFADGAVDDHSTHSDRRPGVDKEIRAGIRIRQERDIVYIGIDPHQVRAANKRLWQCDLDHRSIGA